MNGHTHETGAVLLASVMMPALSLSIKETPLTTAVFIGSALIGGLLPDADQEKSTIGRRIFPIAWPVYLLRAVLRGIAKIIPSFRKLTRTLGHRGISHAPALWLLILLPGLFFTTGIGKTAVIGLAIGVISHLILDSISGGIPLMLPVSTKRVSVPFIRIKTGSPAENMILAVMSLLLCYEVISWIS